MMWIAKLSQQQYKDDKTRNNQHGVKDIPIQKEKDLRLRVLADFEDKGSQ